MASTGPEPTLVPTAPAAVSTDVPAAGAGGAGGGGGVPAPVAAGTGGTPEPPAQGGADAGVPELVAGGAGESAGGSSTWNPTSEDDGVLPEIGAPFRDENLDSRDVPRGTVYSFSMPSSASELYPGLNGAYSRAIDVYVPAQYQDGDAAPFIVVQDGPGYTSRMQRALDNLIADGLAPALIAILPDNGGGDSIGSERGLEYDTMSDVYVTFVDTELLPFVLANEQIRGDYPNIALTEDPAGRAAMGCSSGAAAAFTMAWFGADRYRRVLSYSGTFVDQQDPAVPTYTNGAWEYHEHLIAEQDPNKPIRVYLQVGENDNGATRDEASLHNWVLANQRMADVLEEKGYRYQYQFARGAGHCDRGAIGQTLYGALEWLWRGYPAE